MDNWFAFSFPNFAFSFLSVLLEGVPFLLLGAIFSGLIDEFLPSRVMLRYLPKNAFLGICVSAGMGLIFPMCECGIVPVIRRLIGKGLPVSNAIAYMLAAPIVNPIVAISTYMAFRGNHAMEFMFLRLGLGFVVAVIAAFAVHQLPVHAILREGVISAAGPVEHSERRGGNLARRFGNALRVTVTDFFDVMIFFLLGVAVSTVFSTSVNQQIILPLAQNDWLATFSMMTLAVVLALCSTSDAFVVATYTQFPAMSKLAFLVLGPMLDLKLIFIYSAVFRKRFVFGLAVGLFVLVGLICVRLNILNL